VSLKLPALLVVLCLMPARAGSTSVEFMPLEEIVGGSDHVLAAKIVRVDMVNRLGLQVRDRTARTGPGLPNQIRLHLEIGEVLFTTCRRQPRRVVVPLWQAWHYALGTMQDQLQGSTGIFLLIGAGFDPAYPNDFQRGMAERERIEPLVDALRLQRKQSQLSCKEGGTVTGS